MSHRHYEDGGHVFVAADGERSVCSQGFSQVIDRLSTGTPCPDCETLRKRGQRGLDGFDAPATTPCRNGSEVDRG